MHASSCGAPSQQSVIQPWSVMSTFAEGAQDKNMFMQATNQRMSSIEEQVRVST